MKKEYIQKIVRETWNQDEKKKLLKKRKIEIELEILMLESAILEENWLKKTLMTLGVGLSTLTGALGQENLDKLKYSEDKKEVIEKSLQDEKVTNKLKEFGVEDNNIKRSIDYLKGKEAIRYVDKVAKSEKDLKLWLGRGYHLTSVEADTIYDTIQIINPDTTARQMELSFEDEAFFESGRFILTQNAVNKIKKSINDISAIDGKITGAIVKSSTDKQGLSVNLQKTLNSLGYKNNNEGLSNARNDAITKILVENGIDISLIKKIVLFEQGAGTIDDTARYVKVYINYIVKDEVIPEYPKIGEKETTVYKLTKGISKQKRQRSPIIKSSCKISLKTAKSKTICPKWDK